MGTRSMWRCSIPEVVVLLFLLYVLVGIFVPVSGPSRITSKGGRALVRIKGMCLALDRYYHDFGAYPPDNITLIGGTAEHGMSEVPVHYLCREHRTSSGRIRGAYLGIFDTNLTDEDNDGFCEFRDPWGGLYLYAENASHATPTGMNPKSFDLVSAGRDAELGGTISPATGYVPATTAEGKAAEEDNVTNWPTSRR